MGKSFLCSRGTVLWWLYTRPRSLVITTGPDHRQVVSVLWKEIRRAPATALQQADGGSAPSSTSVSTISAAGLHLAPSDSTVKMGTDQGRPRLRRPVRGRLQRPARGRPARDRRRGQRRHRADLVVDPRPGRVPPWSWLATRSATIATFRELLTTSPSKARRPSRQSASQASNHPTPATTFRLVGMASRSFLNQMRARSMARNRPGGGRTSWASSRVRRRCGLPAVRLASTRAPEKASRAMNSGPITPLEMLSLALMSAAVWGLIALWLWCGTENRSSKSSPPSGTASSTTLGTGSEPIVVELGA